MSICMVTYQMAFLHHPLHELRTGFDVIPNQEKRRLYLMFFQHIQYLFRIAIFIPAVLFRR